MSTVERSNLSRTAKLETSASGREPLGNVIARLGRLIFLSFVAVVFVIPLIWLILAPTKSNDELTSQAALSFGSFSGLATSWGNLMSYNDGEVLRWLANSVGYSAAGVVLSVVAAIPAGYVLAMHRFKGRRAVLLLTLIGMILPAAATVIPIYRELEWFGLTDSIWAVILPSAFFPFGVYLTFLHFQTALPAELVEAARIDGAGPLRIFWSLGLPLSRSAAALTAFFSFVANWNNYFLPYVMLVDDKLYTLQLGLSTLLASAPVISTGTQSNLPIHRPEAALAALLTVIPIAIFFMLFQRVVGKGMLSGAVKG